MLENQKKKRIYGIKEMLHKSPSKRSFTSGIHSLLKRADAIGNADIHLPVTPIASLCVRRSY